MRRLYRLMMLSVLLNSPLLLAQSKQFLYVSDLRVVTIELADAESLVLNYINLGDSFELLKAHQVILIDAEGGTYRGHLFKIENPPKPEDLYKVSYLVKPGEFAGYVIVGGFDFKAPIARVMIQVSSRILELEGMSPKQFELMVSRIGEIDLEEKDRKLAIELAGFRRGYGKMLFSGSEEASILEKFFVEESVVPPVTLATPLPLLPSADAGLPDPVVVRVKATVSKAGGLREIEAIEGPNQKLNKIAVETVQNSWRFLPAVSNNELAEAELKLNVVFRRQ